MKNFRANFILMLGYLPFILLWGVVFILDSALTYNTGIGKTVGFYVIMSLIPLGSFLCFMVYKNKVQICSSDLLISLFVVLAVAITYANYPQWNGKMITLIQLLVLYFSFRFFLMQKKENGNLILSIIMFTGVALAMWGIFQLYGIVPSQHSGFSITGPFFNPGPYAGYLTAIFPCALFYTLHDNQYLGSNTRRKKIYYRLRFGITSAAVASIILILPATLSRAAWIAAGISGILVLSIYLVQYKKDHIFFAKKFSIKRRIAVTTLALILSIICITALYHLKKDSADGRALIWKVSLTVAKKQWIGVGLGYFGGRFGDAQGDYFASGQGTDEQKLLAGEPEYAFNDFLQIIVELGILLFFILVTIFVKAFILGIRNGKIAEIGTLTAILIFAMFSYPFNLIPFLILLVFILASCVTPNRNLKSEEVSYLTREPIYPWNSIKVQKAVLLVNWAIVICCIKIMYPVYTSNLIWGQNRYLFSMNSYEEVITQYQPLYSDLKDQAQFLFEYGQALSKTEKYDESIAVLTQASYLSGDPMFLIILGKNLMGLKNYRMAQTYFKRASERVPHRLYPYYMLSKAYYDAGDFSNAIKTANYVLTKKVKIDSPATGEMREEMKKMIKSLKTN